MLMRCEYVLASTGSCTGEFISMVNIQTVVSSIGSVDRSTNCIAGKRRRMLESATMELNRKFRQLVV